MWSVASTVLQDLCPNQAVVGAAAGTVLSPKRGRSWSLRLGREELSLHSLGRLGHVPLETRGYPSPLPGRGWREVTHLFVPLPLILNPVYHRELSPSGLSKQSVNRIFTPFVQYSEKRCRKRKWGPIQSLMRKPRHKSTFSQRGSILLVNCPQSCLLPSPDHRLHLLPPSKPSTHI